MRSARRDHAAGVFMGQGPTPGADKKAPRRGGGQVGGDWGIAGLFGCDRGNFDQRALGQFGAAY